MKTLKKVSTGSLALLVVAILFFCLQVTSLPNDAQDASNPRDFQLGPVPFDRFAEVVPLEDVVNQLTERGLAIHIPTDLPNEFELMAVYAVVQEGKIGNLMILVYSNTGDARISSGELTVEIAPGGIPYDVSDSSVDRFMEIGNRRVFVCERAPVGWREYYEKYGTEYAILLDLAIAGFNYEFRFSPAFKLEDAMDVVSSMRQARTGTA